MSDSPIPVAIQRLIEKYGRPPTADEQPAKDQAADEALIKTVIADLNALGSHLGLPKQFVYHDFKYDLAQLMMLRQVYVKRETVFRAIYNDWRKVDLALMRRDLATMAQMKQFDGLTIEQIINAGSNRP